jgi:hypothetical protein
LSTAADVFCVSSTALRPFMLTILV